MSEPRTFKIQMSERCFQFKLAALGDHAPKKPGVYKFMTFNAEMQPEVLFVGLAIPGEGESIHDAVAAHMMGNVRPNSDDLFKTAKDIYFDYVDAADIDDPEDFKDIAGALIEKHKPRLNPSTPPPSTGKYGTITLEEVD